MESAQDGQGLCDLNNDSSQYYSDVDTLNHDIIILCTHKVIPQL